MLTRILTEDILGTENIVAELFDGFTVIHVTGYWKGQQEKSVIFEIVDADPQTVLACVELINHINKQECCLIQNIGCDSQFVCSEMKY
jgi:hypothetical protein